MTDKDLKLGAEIAAARTAAGLSKEAAAKKAKVSTTTWRRAEAGERMQSHKLAAIMTAVGIPAFATGNEGESIDPFILPPGIESGYVATVAFTRAVAEEVPELAKRATRLMLDASALFAQAGDAVFQRELEGGDGDADSTEPEAGPTKLRPVDPLKVDEAAYDPEKDKRQD